jgi:hypothetical protein
MMATATIIITDDEVEDQLHIVAEFDPPIQNEYGDENPATHVAAIIAIEAITLALAEAE